MDGQDDLPPLMAFYHKSIGVAEVVFPSQEKSMQVYLVLKLLANAAGR